MGSIIKDESDNIYGKWTVVCRHASTTTSAAWLCQCKCGYKMPILGINLRRQKLPLCTNCCRYCNKTKEEVKFKGNKRICIDCDKKRIKEWKHGNVAYKEKIVSWSHKNPKAIEKYRQNERIRIQSTPQNFLRAIFKDKCRKAKGLSNNLDHRAQQKAKHIERHQVSISESEVLALWDKQNGKCAISGMPMIHEFKNLCSVSLDRIDSGVGYTLENTQLICRWVNLAKNNFSDAIIRQVLDDFKCS